MAVEREQNIPVKKCRPGRCKWYMVQSLDGTFPLLEKTAEDFVNESALLRTIGQTSNQIRDMERRAHLAESQLKVSVGLIFVPSLSL